MKPYRKKIFLLPLVLFTCSLLRGEGFAEEIKPVNEAINPKTGQLLAEYRHWLYTREREEAPWRKLIPGQCPQWFSDGERFLYFLDVGYDGDRAELWSADATGEARIRLTHSDYWIGKSPVLSSDGKNLAYCYSTCMAAGGYENIVVIDLRRTSFDEKQEAKVVLMKPAFTKIASLRWIAGDRLEAVVNGEKMVIDTSQAGEELLP